MTRTSSLVRAAAASVAVVVAMSGCTSAEDEPAAAAPSEDVTTTDDGGDEQEDYDGGGDLPTTEPGTFTYDNGPFPVTFTTTVPTIDPSQGGDPYRVLLGDPYGIFSFDFPVDVADLSQPVTSEDSGDVESVEAGSDDLVFAGPLDVPTDIGAWLEGAASLEIVDEGTLSLAGGDASWWDLEVTDPSAICFADTPPDEDPCVVLWPYLAEQNDRQIGDWVLDSARVYAIEFGSEPLMAVAGIGGTPDEEVAGWLATTDEIVASITLE